MSERLVVLSTGAKAEDAERIAHALVELHPYDVPEALALPVEDGLAPYLAWLDDAARGG